MLLDTADMGLANAFFSKVWGAIDRVLDVYWEKRLGIHTAGHATVDYADAKFYMSPRYRTHMAVLRHCRLVESDVVVDVGCGMGRVLCCAARFPVRLVIGVEIDPRLCEIARENARRMRGRRAPIEVENVSAEQFDYGTATIVILVNPFGEATLAKVIDRIEQSLRGNPRTLRIVYFNPVHEEMLLRIPWLRRFEHWPARPLTGVKFAISFWETVAP